MPKRLTPRGEAAPPVEPINTGARLPTKEEATTKRPQRKPKATDSGVRYVRNLHHILARITLTSGREILLKPRGEREDLDIVNAEEQEDPKFLANKDLLFEVLSSEQAKAIIYKQQTNAREQGHTLYQHFVNSKGEKYENGTVGGMQAHGGHAAITVGQVDQVGGGRYTDKNFEVTRSAGARYTEVPGSPGHKATEFMQSVPGHISPEEYHEFLLWKQFKEAQEAQETAEEPESA